MRRRRQRRRCAAASLRLLRLRLLALPRGLIELALLFALVAVAAAPVVAGEPLDQRFLDGLRQRRLFELAADFCQDRLADQGLSDAERAALTIELARCRAGQALHAAPADRDAYWQAAGDVLGEFVRRNPRHPRLFLVRVQEALLFLARGELARQEAEVGADAEQALVAARDLLRSAARRLEDLEKDLEREIPQRLSARLGPGELSSSELASLLDNVRYQLARAYRNQALAYPAGSADRVNALTLAIGRLTQVQQSIGNADALAWSCRLDLAACQRLLEKFTEAAQQLDALEDETREPSVVLQSRAERARLALAQGRTDQALAALTAGRAFGGATSAEWDFAHLETYIDLWKAAEAKDQQNDAADWRNKALAMTRLIEESHGPYWRRRAESLLTRSAAGGASAGDLEILVRTARDHYLRQRPDEAVQAFDAAARQARAAGDAKRAFELFYQAAAIEHERSRRSEAAERFRDLALAMPTQPQAAQAHLLACFDLAQAAREDPSRLETYAAALEENIRLWPNEADQARLWLGKLREAQQRWGEAVAAYRGVAAHHAEYETAMAAAARCWLRRLAEIEAANADRLHEVEEAARFFERIVAEAKADAPAAQLAAARIASVAAAKVRLRHLPEGQGAAERVLRAALALPAPSPDEWRAEATGLLVVALAGQPQRVGEALTILRDAGGASPQTLWEMIHSLASLLTETPPNARPPLANLILQALDLLGPGESQLAAAERTAAQALRAEALAAAGRPDEATRLYRQLTRQHPQDGSIQEGFARALLAGNDPPSRVEALQQWRVVAQGSRPRSDRWWRAKYQVALLLFQNGDRAQAAQLIRYLQEVPPGLSDTSLQSDFLDLLRRCE